MLDTWHIRIRDHLMSSVHIRRMFAWEKPWSHIKSPRSPRTSQDLSLRFLLVLRCLWGSCSTFYCIRWIHCRPVEMLHEIMQIGLPSQMHLSLLQHNHEIMCHYCAWLSCFLMLSVGYLIDQLNESKWSIKENAEGFGWANGLSNGSLWLQQINRCKLANNPIDLGP